MIKKSRRNFIKKSALAGIGMGLAGKAFNMTGMQDVIKGKRVGMIGLDTGHSIAFARGLNDPLAGDKYFGYKVVAAYPNGTENIEVWKNRIPEFTELVKNQGVEIVDSIDQMLKKVDVVLLTCIDGNRHLDQALPVLKAGKPLFIDKPLAGTLTDAYKIFDASKQYKVPVFSASSLRYIAGAKEIEEGQVGKVIGAEAYSPAHLEEHHPDLFWYGVHGVEILFTIMGTGCTSVKRTFTENTDLVVGVWENDRIGSYRGIREGKGSYGGTVFGEKGISVLGEYRGYGPLLEKICEFFSTGIAPVSQEETLEIFAFMEAADESKRKGGTSVDVELIIKNAKSQAAN